MKKVVITCTLVLAMITSLLAACSCGEKVIDIPELEPFTNEAMGISGIVPEGWNEAAPGVYARGDMTTDQTAIIQQAAPGTTAEQLTAALLPQLGIEEFPESVGSYESTALTWDLYIIEAEAPGVTIMVDVALAETDAATYLILLQAMPDEYDVLHESIFIPAIDALTPLAPEGEEPRYEDPNGLFSVPIPTNWTAEQGDGYGILTSPEGGITVYVLTVESDDIEEAVSAAWAIVDPAFDLEPDEVIEAPPIGTKEGAEKAFTITYDTGDETEVILAGGWVYQGIVYVELFKADLVALQQRISQLQIIDTGFTINALEVTNLSGVEPLPLTNELIAELEAYIADTMELLDVPGVAVAIVKDGEIVYANGFGIRELGGNDPVTPETLMMIGSTTKSMTTMMMATLVDDGLMDWDTLVIDILPTFAVADPDITQRITVRNLVCACTGVPRRDAELLFNANDLSAKDIIESLADFEFFTDFGEAFQYSNQMVATGGYVATLAAGGEYGNLYDSYLALMQERIFGPIGMTSSTFSLEEAQASPNHATPHSMTLAGEYVTIPLSREALVTPVAPAGSLWSNVLDMGRYLITELNEGVAPDGTPVVSAENLAITWEPQVAITADASYGLGWIVDEYKGLLMLQHGGNTLGFTSDLAFLPEIDMGISVLTNQYGSILNQAVRFRLLELLYQQEAEFDELIQFYIDRTEEALAELNAQIADSVDPEAVAPYVGVYANDALGEIIITLDDDDVLTLDAGEFLMELLPKVDEDGEVEAYRSVTPGLGGEFQFSEDDDGNPIIIIGEGAYEYIFDKVE